MHKLEKHNQIMYDSWNDYYMVHTPRANVQFYKDEQGLPYINLDGSAHEAAMMLMQLGMGQHVTFDQSAAGKTEHTLVETVQENYKGYMKKDVVKAKEAWQTQAMMGNSSKKDYKGEVSNHLISNCPVTHTNITNARAILGPDLMSIRGKTVPRMPASVVTDYVVAVP